MTLDTWIRFCEPPYVRSESIAEWWNAISSLAYCLVGLCFIHRSEKFHANFPEAFCQRIVWINRMFGITWLILGLGSASFHAFQTIPSELWDEIGMFIVTFWTSLCMYGLHPVTSGTSALWFYGAYIIFVLTTIFVYIEIMNHQFFVLMFLISVLIPLVIGASLPTTEHTDSQRSKLQSLVLDLTEVHSFLGRLTSAQTVRCSVTLALVGYIAWQTDQHCVKSGWAPSNPQLYELDWYYWCHPIWHTLTAIASMIGCDALLKVRVESHYYNRESYFFAE